MKSIKFRKKPIVVEAIQLTSDSFDDCIEFIGEENLGDGTDKEEGCITIDTLEGVFDAHSDYGDWIIKGIKGEFYPCKPDIFEATYEKVED